MKFLNTYVGEKMSASDNLFTVDVINRTSQKSRDYIEIIDIKNTPRENKAVLRDAEFILTVPLHPLILGASEGVPVLSLAYASKNVCFMKQIKQDKYIYRVENLGDKIPMERVLNDIDFIVKNRAKCSKEIQQIVKPLKELERMNAKLLLDLVNAQ